MELYPESCGVTESHRWKACHRVMQPEDRFFEAGDLACRFTCHKFTCISSNDDAMCQSSLRSSSDSLISCGQLGCSKQFSSLNMYEMHYNTVHRYVCSICRRCFPNQHLLDIHILEWHDAFFQLQSLSDNMYRCLVESCAEKCQTFVERTNHMIAVHKYPGSFRFITTQKHDTRSRNNSVDEKMASKSDTSNTPTMDVDPCSLPEDVMSAGCSQQQQPPRTFTYRVPKSICFGHGSARGFQSKHRQTKSVKQTKNCTA